MKPLYLKPVNLKPLYLKSTCVSLILACLCQGAQAQLLDQLGNQVEGVTRELEQVTDDVQEQVRKAAEDELSGSLDNPVVNPLTDALGKTVDGVAQTTDAVVQTTGDIAGNALASSLPILNRTGATVFVEVRVEDNWRAVEREWLMLLDQPGLKALSALDAEIIEQTQFADLGLQLVRFRVPAVLDSLRELKKHLPAHLHEQLDRNHIYSPQRGGPHGVHQAKENPPSANPPAAISKPMCDQAVSIGVIDTAINTQHVAFAKSHIESQDFAGAEFDAPRAHGTAVAGLLVGMDGGGERNQQLIPLLPAAKVFAASVFYPRSDYAQGATMINLVRALNWLAEKKVRVINMSLAGPDNKILALAIQKTIQAGINIVAAAGNEGPAAPPAYPAAYADVIAVTAVDKNQRIYRWANRGDYIDFAALGVAVFTARSTGDFGNESGTSMAAPLVTAAVACTAQGTFAIEQLKKLAQDLGVPGRDPVFGDGFLHRP